MNEFQDSNGGLTKPNQSVGRKTPCYGPLWYPLINTYRTATTSSTSSFLSICCATAGLVLAWRPGSSRCFLCTGACLLPLICDRHSTPSSLMFRKSNQSWVDWTASLPARATPLCSYPSHIGFLAKSRGYLKSNESLHPGANERRYYQGRPSSQHYKSTGQHWHLYRKCETLIDSSPDPLCPIAKVWEWYHHWLGFHLDHTTVRDSWFWLEPCRTRRLSWLRARHRTHSLLLSWPGKICRLRCHLSEWP